MEAKPQWIVEQIEQIKSPGARTIYHRLEECLIYVRDKKRVYADTKELALEFGKHGTKNFFSLPLLIGLIEQDDRFKPYLVKSRMAGF